MKINYSPPKNSFLEKIHPWIGSLFLFPIMVYFTTNIGNYLLIDVVNLLIHEGGHGVFRFFGKFVYTLGGSLMQIIIPSMFIVYYLIKKNVFGAQVFLVWLGQNLFNISIYVSDARSQNLPLLGGNRVYHDWHYLLGVLNLLEFDTIIGDLLIFLGIAIFGIAIVIPLFLKKEKMENVELNL